MTRIMKTLCIALLSVACVAGSALSARAEDRRECERRIHQAEDKLRDAVQHHGEDSKQARKRREQLEQERRKCPDYDRDHHDHDMH